MLAAAYELINSNAKWQVESDSALHALGLKLLLEVSQLFFGVVDGSNTNLIIIRIVHVLLTAVTDGVLPANSIEFCRKLALGIISHGPGLIHFFGLNVVRNG